MIDLLWILLIALLVGLTLAWIEVCDRTGRTP